MGTIDRSREQKLVERLESAIASDRVSHAYIFEGDGGMDKKAFAEAFALELLCHEDVSVNRRNIENKIKHGNHESIIYVDDENGVIKDEKIIDLQRRLNVKSYGACRIVIISGSDGMTERAQNRMLKTLEEPPDNSVIILLAENIENLLPTILSRCVKYRISSDCGVDTGLSDDVVEFAEQMLSGAAFYSVKRAGDDILKEIGDIGTLFDLLERYFRNELVGYENRISPHKSADLVKAIHEVETARRKVNAGVTEAFALRSLILKIGG